MNNHRVLFGIAFTVAALQFVVLTLTGRPWLTAIVWALACGPGWLLAIYALEAIAGRIGQLFERE